MDRYIIDYTLKNGLGNPAISIYLTGCDKPKKCYGCHNWELQKESREDYSINEIKQRIDEQINSFLEYHKVLYIAFLGGDPLTEYNRNITSQISNYIKQKYPNAITVLYSWREIDLIKEGGLREYVKYIDYGVLGEYNNKLHIEKALPSSENQYIYDFKNNKKLKPIKLK